MYWRGDADIDFFKGCKCLEFEKKLTRSERLKTPQQLLTFLKFSDLRNWNYDIFVQFVGKYVFGDILGEGSYARVKECVDSETLGR